LRLCLSLIEGSDNREWEVPPAPVENATQRPLSQYRFAFLDEFGGVPVTAETREAIKKLAVTLEQMGCRVEYRNPPNFNFVEALLTYGEIAGAESVAAVSGLERLRWRMLSLVPSRVVNAGPVAHGFAKGGALNMRWYTEALTRRDALIGAMQEFLSDWDAWICPVAAGSAFTHRQMMSILGSPLEVDNQKLPYWVWGISYTAVFNLTGNPVVAMPYQRFPVKRVLLILLGGICTYELSFSSCISWGSP
jgi:amidase